MRFNFFNRAGNKEQNFRADEPETSPWDSLSEIEFAGGGLTGPSTESTEEVEAADFETSVASGMEDSETNSGSFENAEQDEQGRQTLEAFKHFFETDVKIKEAIADIAPDAADLYDESSRMRYLDQAAREFSDFQPDFQAMIREFQLGENVADSTKDFFNRGEEALATSNFDTDTIARIYQNQFYGMRGGFMDEVQSRAVGYTWFRDPSKLINRADSVNELLHAFHSTIMNNEENLQKIPQLDTKYGVTLRGEADGLGSAIYDAIPEDLDIGVTDIISVDDKALMMVRDRAHALMIEAEPLKERPGEIIVHYNLPKLIDREMVEALPGIGRISKNGASGRFAVPEAELGERLVDFIGRVPTDDDLPEIRRILEERAKASEQ